MSATPLVGSATKPGINSDTIETPTRKTKVEDPEKETIVINKIRQEVGKNPETEDKHQHQKTNRRNKRALKIKEHSQFQKFTL